LFDEVHIVYGFLEFFEELRLERGQGLGLDERQVLRSSRTKLALLSLISSKTFIVFFIMPRGCFIKLLHFFERNP
jgi:hypothetical protein